MSKAKMYNKNELKYKGGYIVKGDDVIAIDNEIVDLFNKLDTDVQYAKFLAMKESFQVDTSDMEFFRATERGNVYLHVEFDTPNLDEFASKTEAMMDEIDNLNKAEMMNEYLQTIKPLLIFANDNFVIAAEHGVPHRFDLPAIGNPLELTREDIGNLVISMFS